MGSGGSCQTCKKKRLCNAFDNMTGKDNNLDEDLIEILAGQVEEPQQINRHKISSGVKRKKNTNLHVQKGQVFENWGLTVKLTYEKILYPRSVEEIQEFVRMVKMKGKSVRGSGLRHSWSQIFADEDNFLVSFYPKQVATGQFQQLVDFVRQIQRRGLHKVKNGLYSIEKMGKQGDKTLVRFGAGVSNEQLRIWCLKNDVQYQANVIMVEVNFCGALGTCSHGSGIKNPPIPDFIYQIQFINCRGEIQAINKKDHPELIKSAAGNMGLLGLTVFVTVEMIPERSAIMHPRRGIGQKIVPRPGRRSQLFETQCRMSYCEWFYFTKQDQTFANIFESVAKEKGQINPEFPPPVLVKLSDLALDINGFFQENGLKNMTYLAFRVPYVFFPGTFNPFKKEVKVDFMDAIHFQRAIQNFRVRSFQVEIGLPRKGDELDYELVQKVWWYSMDYVKNHSDVIDMALQMRLLKGSECPLAPEYGLDYVCSIQLVRTVILSTQVEQKWNKVVQDIWGIWSNLTDYTGKKVLVRPHWGKEWDQFDFIKDSLFKDTVLMNGFQKFKNDYEKISKLGGWEKDDGYKLFSNKAYNEFLSKR